MFLYLKIYIQFLVLRPPSRVSFLSTAKPMPVHPISTGLAERVCPETIKPDGMKHSEPWSKAHERYTVLKW